MLLAETPSFYSSMYFLQPEVSALYYKQNLHNFFAFPRHLTFLFLAFRKFLKPNRPFKMKMYSDVPDDLMCPNQSRTSRQRCTWRHRKRSCSRCLTNDTNRPRELHISSDDTWRPHWHKRLATGLFLCLPRLRQSEGEEESEEHGRRERHLYLRGGVIC
jgi:hypothetical protein